MATSAQPMPEERQLPRPTGYRILIGLPTTETVSEGGIILTAKTANQEATSSIVGKVLALGPDAYADMSRFPNGAWCAEGDWIIMRSYSGTRFTVDDVEYRLIPDDGVEGVTDAPEGIKRV
jgi:co-chaperonin GroES (HSP10)